YGVSFIIIMVNAGIADLILYIAVHRSTSDSSSLHCFPSRKFAFFGLICILPLTLLTVILSYGVSWLSHYKPQEGPTVCMVQGNIPQDMKFESNEEDEINILKQYTDLSMSVKGTPIDLLVWPETMVPGLLNIDPELTGRKIDVLSQLTPIQLSQELNTNLLLGGIALTLAGDEQIYFNSAYYYNREGKADGCYDKIHLVPFGEFTPLKNYFPFLTKLVPYKIGLTHGRHRTLFRLDTLQHESFDFGTSICYEDTVPSLIRKFKKDGADFMLNITNDGWFR
ncbi:MAG: apolipoprotein N-acyltransferase, partial [Planctomycetes bacterium RIFOXYD12_FULL_42_12]